MGVRTVARTVWIVSAAVVMLSWSPARAEPENAQRAALYDVIHRKDHDALREALASKPALDVPDERQRLPLSEAVSMNDPEAVEMLLKAGASANPSSRVAALMPPLSAAINLNNPKTVGLLLDAGAPIAVRDGSGYSMFERAFGRTQSGGRATPKDPKDQQAVIQLLFDTMQRRQETRTPVSKLDPAVCLDDALGAACMNGNREWAGRLLDAGADVNSVVRSRVTPLMQATIGSSEEVVRFLLERGADPHAAPPPSKWTALFHAVVLCKNVPIVKLLLAQKGVREHQLTNVDLYEPVLIAAIQSGCGESLRLVYEAIGMPDVASRTKEDLLKFAITCRKPESVETLLKLGVKPGVIRYEETRTHLEYAKLFLEAGNTQEIRKIVELLSPPPPGP